MSEACNEIFAMPLSFIFVIFLSLSGQNWYEVIIEGESKGIIFASVCTVTTLLLLIFASQPGDAYWDARASLLRPDISMGLLQALGRDEQAVFMRSLERTQLGLDIVNVKITTNKVPVVILQRTFLD